MQISHNGTLNSKVNLKGLMLRAYLMLRILMLRILLTARLRRFVAIAVPFILLAGCVNQTSGDRFTQPIADVIPDSKVVDFGTAPCETLWTLEGNDAMSNSLYWLRAMDCAERMGDTDARSHAQQITATRWDNAFKQSILFSAAQPNEQQRKALLVSVNAYRAEMPSSIRSLVQLWRERQTLQVTLSNEKARYIRQQSLSENKIESMVQEHALLQDKLFNTQRKLENLTDIERKLSSRKQLQNDLPDTETNAVSPFGEVKKSVVSQSSVNSEEANRSANPVTSAEPAQAKE